MTDGALVDRNEVSSTRVPRLSLEALGCLTFPLTIAA